MMPVPVLPVGGKAAPAIIIIVLGALAAVALMDRHMAAKQPVAQPQK